MLSQKLSCLFVQALHLSYKTQLQGAACLGLVHGDDPERCCGEGGERGVHVWERM